MQKSNTNEYHRTIIIKVFEILSNYHFPPAVGLIRACRTMINTASPKPDSPQTSSRAEGTWRTVPDKRDSQAGILEGFLEQIEAFRVCVPEKMEYRASSSIELTRRISTRHSPKECFRGYFEFHSLHFQGTTCSKNNVYSINKQN